MSDPALPHAVDLVLTNGRITTFADEHGPAEAQSVAIAGGRILAVGSDGELAGYQAIAERVVDVGGRRVIPGLFDSHVHAMRAGVSWTVSLHWEDVRSIEDGLAMIRARAAEVPAGTWIAVIGGWHRRQLAERRVPTPQELTAAAPDHPVYVQETYDVGVLNEAGLGACGWAGASVEDPPRGRLERGEDGRASGVILGVGAFAVPLGLVHAIDRDEARAGTVAMTRDFAAHGLTTVADGGGLLVRPSDYEPLFDAWRDGDLAVRFRLFYSAWDRGGELANVSALTELQQHDFGDGIVKVAGVGELLHFGAHDLEGFEEFVVDDTTVAGLIEISRVIAERGWRAQMHAVLGPTLDRVLEAWEAVERETGLIRGRRWAIVHADSASPGQLDRMAALGLGALVQNRHLLKGGDYVEHWGEEATAHAEPIAGMLARGIPIGLGSDATRANWFSPWASIAWFVTGRSVDGAGVRAGEHLLSREAAIRAYTAGPAWFTGEEDRLGRIAPGFEADLAVLDADPFAVDDDALAAIRSDLTIMGGRVTHASPAFREGADR